ncbi:MAG: uL14 family ribosomal protein [Nanoarchaeota archaeon]|nr:uL14 family ribosomal protein [Nanoarchaeota archaeon]MBU4452354.1 uL14 family ribosomal protein [Nanoarchaeota archaeon]MCG2723369.1 uL14 family ribosomal protein [archaeon]
MKAISIRMTKTLQSGSFMTCADNTGAKELQLISVLGYGGVKKRHPRAGIGDVVICSVTKGNQKIKHELVRAVIVRQAGEYKRANGMHVSFEDNAAVIVDEKNEPKGKEIKSVIAKEAVERFSVIGKVARSVV